MRNFVGVERLVELKFASVTWFRWIASLLIYEELARFQRHPRPSLAAQCLKRVWSESSDTSTMVALVD